LGGNADPSEGRTSVVDGSGKVRAGIGGEIDAVVVGAGFGGMYMLLKLRELGLNVQGFEAGTDVGGVWWWNRYPGARCDVPSLFYSYTFSMALQKDWRWTEKYAAQPEILSYANHVADRFELRPMVAFETRVLSAAFDDAADRWTVVTDRGDEIRTRFLIMATGCLSTPRKLTIPGLHDFRGRTYRTAMWPHEGVDFSGLRVAVIGTGSSGVQLIPQVARQAAHLTVFQRSANFCVPANNRPLSDKDFDDFWEIYPGYIASVKGPGHGFGGNPAYTRPATPQERRRRYEECWAVGGARFLDEWGCIITDVDVNAEAADFVREKICEAVDNPKTAEALKPYDHPIGAKHICVDIDYYQTYNRANVTLVNLKETPIEAITSTGIRTTEEAYEIDALVFATGFDAMTGALLAIQISGARGRLLKDAWAKGARALLGLAVAGFPNMFIITGPGSPSVLSNMINSIEHHVEWIADCLAYMRKNGFVRIEADQDAQEMWVAHVNRIADNTLFPLAASWYMSAENTDAPRLFLPYIGPGYRQKCDHVAALGYEGFALAKGHTGGT
jgi:cyclohexanone monooxygenase